MCGIWASVLKDIDAKPHLYRLVSRGPDGQNVQVFRNGVLGFTHLSINGSQGMQPVISNEVAIVCNGEIYNYKELAKHYDIVIPEGGSDCSILPELFRKTSGVTEFCRVLDGVFAMCIYDQRTDRLYAMRDPYGVRPLFHAQYEIFASVAKAIPPTLCVAEQFRPGTWMVNKLVTEYHTIPIVKQPFLDEHMNATHALWSALTKSVRKRLLSDKPIGALLSGGLDSSLIVSILARHVYPLHTFSIGLEDSKDLQCAREVAAYLGTIHHEVIITEDDYKNAIPAVIYDIESCDITTVRASVGNWLIGKYIRENTDIKVVFNGDGSDEVGGGYRYFQRAPSDYAFEDECCRLLTDICYFDGLRSDRCISAHGLEPRSPYLDKQFVATWLGISTELRRTGIEKKILRDAFVGYLPDEILYRKKEAFSDGMSSNVPWKTIKDEALYYKTLYNAHFPGQLVPYTWMPRWSPETSDPSAKTLSIY